ncbi:hypothetical protein Tco_0953725 [Tanacetum coccineum]|uniref:Uncharacterized protein n=1 Tax=Tanacetum coccineum TaxID=301880 RepID=A0ABQ5E0S5_9ASTR
MSNSNTNLQTQSSNALHNAIMEAGSKDRPPIHYVITECQSCEPFSIYTSQGRNDIYSKVDACSDMYVNVEKPLTVETRFVTLVKQSQELKTVSYHKLYDILKQHQNEVNEIRTKRLARTANPLALCLKQQPVYHHQNHPTQNTQYSSTRSQQSTRNRGKAIVTSSAPTYDPEPATVTKDEEMSKEKEIDKLMALISLSFKKIYKPTNNNLELHQTPVDLIKIILQRINRGTGYDNKRVVNVAGARENVGTPVVQKSGIQCYNMQEYGHVSGMSKKPETSKDAAFHKEKMLLWNWSTYMYMATNFKVTPVPVDSFWTIFDDEPMHRAQDDQDETDDLDQERDLLASLIQKLKCEIDDSKNRNKFLESSNKELVDKLKGLINCCLRLKKFQAELDKYNDVNYASKVEIDCAKAKGDLMSYKIDFEKSSNAYTQKINDLNQRFHIMKKELCAIKNISKMSQAMRLRLKLLQNS